MLGIWQLAYSTNKNAKMVFDPKLADITVQKIYDRIKNYENEDIKNSFVSISEANDLIKPNTLLIITDTQSPNRAMFPELINKVPNISVIDHHRAGEVGYKETLSYYVETSASSTVELVTEMFLFYNANVVIDKLIASIMLSGIVVDTNNFTYRTRTRTFEAASTLNTMGADMVLVRKLLRDSYEEERRIASAMVNVEIFEKRFAIVAQDENDIVPDRTTLAKISDKLLTIDGIETAFAIGMLPDGLVAISARSMDAVNVQIIMEELNGGGHFNAAATQLKDTTIAEAKEMLIQILRRDFVETGDETMKVILIADVKGKGKKDDILDVANGYGNFLINNKLALLATDDNLKNLKAQQEQERINNENRRNVLEKVKSEIQDKFISVYLKVGADGKNFGHITSKYVCDEFEAQTGIHLDKKKVEIPVINSVGIYTASVKLDKDIVATFEVNVIEK
jgi:ribosomal protein L9